MVRHELSLLGRADAHGVQPDALPLERRAPPLQLDEELLAEGSAETPQERDDGDPFWNGVFQSRPRAVGREEGQVRDDGTVTHRLGLFGYITRHDLAAAVLSDGGELRRESRRRRDECRSLRQRQR